MSDVKEKNKQALGPVGNGIFGTVTISPESISEEKQKKEKPVKDLVAIHSPKNIYWSGVGKILKGYNIVERHNAEKWLTRPGIRIAPPEEVAKEYGL
jgi:hypothetical protein